MADRLAEIEAAAAHGHHPWWDSDEAPTDLGRVVAVVDAAGGVDTRCVVALRTARYEERCGECSHCLLRAALANLEGGA